MWKYAVVGLVAFAGGVFVAKLGYEKKVRDAIRSPLEKVGLAGGFIEQTVDALAGV